MISLQKMDSRPKAALGEETRGGYCSLSPNTFCSGGCLQVKHSATVEATDHWADDKDARGRGCGGASRGLTVVGRYCRARGGALRVCHTRSGYAKLRCFVLLPKAGS